MILFSSPPPGGPQPTRQPKLPSICEAEVFALTRKQRPCAKSTHFVLYLICPEPRPENPADPATVHARASLGLVIGKHQLRRAHQRNRVKRVIREAFRLEQGNLAAQPWIVRLTRKPPWADKAAGEFRHNCRAEIVSLLAAALERTAP